MASQLTKIRFGLDIREWHGHGGEFLWAEPINDAIAQSFRVLNSPFFTKGINYHDVVKAHKSSEDLGLEFDEVVSRSGHSTYMIVTQKDEPRLDAYWDRLRQKGCSYESMEMNFSMGRRQLMSVDVPPAANIHDVYAVLQKGEDEGVWMFQEGYAHLPKASSG